MKKEILILFSICIIAIPLFWLGNFLKPGPNSTAAGNGNPAILIMFILLVLFITMIYFWVKIINNYSIKLFVSISGILFISAHLIISILYLNGSLLIRREVLAEVYEQKFGFVDWEYIDTITSFPSLSIQLNSLYFNINTYFMFITSAILISIILSFIPQIRRLSIIQN